MFFAEYPQIENARSIPFLLYAIGKETVSPKTPSSPVPYYTLIYTKKGCGTLTSPAFTFSLLPHSVACISVDCAYECTPLTEDWEFLWVQYLPFGIENFMQEVSLSASQILSLSHPFLIENLLEQMLYLLRTHDTYAVYQCAPLLYQCLLELHIEHSRQHIAPTASDQQYMQLATQFIQMHYTENITLSDIAKQAKISPSYLCTLFQHTLQVRPVEYIRQKRIEQAKHLLIHTELSVQEIGISVGYADKSYFGYVFKKQERCSPSQFRKLAQA